jgi:hypothetical protein
LEDAGQNFAAVRFLARRDDVALARTAAVELLLDIGFGQIDLRQTAVDDNTNTAPAGLSTFTSLSIVATRPGSTATFDKLSLDGADLGTVLANLPTGSGGPSVSRRASARRLGSLCPPRRLSRPSGPGTWLGWSGRAAR